MPKTTLQFFLDVLGYAESMSMDVEETARCIMNEMRHAGFHIAFNTDPQEMIAEEEVL